MGHCNQLIDINYWQFCLLTIIEPPLENFTLVFPSQIWKHKKSYEVKSQNKVPVVLLMVPIHHKLVLILCLNLHCGSVRASGVTGENIENKPGPFAIRKVVQASHHKSHPRYGDSAGMQCTNTVYLPLFYSTIEDIDN